MLAGLGLRNWLLQRQRPLFPTQGWIIVFSFGFHQSSSFSQEEQLLGSLGLQPDILASDIFIFFTGKTIVCSGFTWLAASGDAELECSCRRCSKPHQCAFVPVLHSPRYWALHVQCQASPRNIPTRKKEWNQMWINDIPISSRRQTSTHFLKVPAMISEQGGQKK